MGAAQSSDSKRLFAAAASGDVTDLQAYETRYGRARLRELDTFRETIGHYAARGGHVAALVHIASRLGEEFLLIRDKDGWTIAHHAAWKGHTDILEDCRKRFGLAVLRETTPMIGKTVAHNAAEGGHVATLVYLAKHLDGNALRARRTDGWTIAHHAASKGHSSVLAFCEQQFGIDMLRETDAMRENITQVAARFGRLAQLEAALAQSGLLGRLLDLEGWSAAAAAAAGPTPEPIISTSVGSSSQPPKATADREEVVKCPPQPPAQAPATVPACNRVQHAEIANIVDVDLKTSIRLNPEFKPPHSLVECMLRCGPALSSVPQLTYIVRQCEAIAADRLRRNPKGPIIDGDAVLSVALYTFDLGRKSKDPQGSDNFYHALNVVFRKRDQGALRALQPFMYHLKAAWTALPVVTGTYYRGVPASAVPLVATKYEDGRMIYWSAITSLSRNRRIAEEFANKGGPGGIVMEVGIVDGRSIAQYSSIPTEDEVILEPSAKFVVTEALTPNPPAGQPHRVLRLKQIKMEGAFIY